MLLVSSGKGFGDIEEVILNDHFPFFIKQSATTNLKGEPNNEPFLKHIILHNLESKRAPDIVNSPHYDLTLDILNNCATSGIAADS